MALKAIYEQTYELKYWLGPSMQPEGWWDQEYTRDGGAPPAVPELDKSPYFLNTCGKFMG